MIMTGFVLAVMEYNWVSELNNTSDCNYCLWWEERLSESNGVNVQYLLLSNY